MARRRHQRSVLLRAFDQCARFLSGFSLQATRFLFYLMKAGRMTSSALSILKTWELNCPMDAELRSRIKATVAETADGSVSGILEHPPQLGRSGENRSASADSSNLSFTPQTPKWCYRLGDPQCDNIGAGEGRVGFRTQFAVDPRWLDIAESAKRMSRCLQSR